jgi:hypothetical protein
MTTLAGDPNPGDLYNVGAVGAADIDEFFLDAAHCTDGDFLPIAGYPHSRAAARKAIANCRTHLATRWKAGLDLADKLVTRSQPFTIVLQEVRQGCAFPDERKAKKEWDRAAQKAQSGGIAERNAVGAAALAISALLQGRAPSLRSAKCKVMNEYGRVLHLVEDYYAHSNWADVADPLRPVGIDNPPGLGAGGRAALLDMSVANPTVNAAAITPCYALPGSSNCAGRVDHDKHLGKDTGTVTVVPGPCPGACRTDQLVTGGPTTPRGQVAIGAVTNFDLAVQGALREVRGNWTDFGTALIGKYGAARGRLMICALTHDDPVPDCTPGAFGTTTLGLRPPTTPPPGPTTTTTIPGPTTSTTSTTTSTTTTTTPGTTTTSTTTTTVAAGIEATSTVCVIQIGQSGLDIFFRLIGVATEFVFGYRVTGPGVVSGAEGQGTFSNGQVVIRIVINRLGTYVAVVTFLGRTFTFEFPVAAHSNACPQAA